MPWIESHTSLRHHPKVGRLARKLSIPSPAAIGLLHCLWHWAVEYAPDGDLSKFNSDEIADAAMFCAWEYDVTADSSTFVKALVDSGWLDESEHSLTLHDWWEYAGQLMDARRQAQEGGKLGNHKRWHVDRGVVDPTCSFCRESVPTSPPESPPDIGKHRPPSRPESHRTVPDRTEQNLDQERVSADFQNFWEAFPRHHSTGKPGGGAPKSETFKKWERLSDSDRQACLVAVVNYAAASALPDAPYAAMATTWINQKRWQDWQEPADTSKARAPTRRDRFVEMGQSLQERVNRMGGVDEQASAVSDQTRRSLPAG